MKRSRLLALVAVGLLTATTVRAQLAAYDNFETFGNGVPPQPSHAYDDGIGYGDNGGTGFGALTYLEGTGGGIYTETGGARLDDAQSLGVYAGSNGQALGRTVTTAVTLGVYTLDARFNLSNANAFSGFNIKSGLGTTFGANELLSFGLNPGNNNSFLVTDATGAHALALASPEELRGAAINFTLTFNTLLATYTLTATDKGNGDTGAITGTLKDTNGLLALGTGALSAIGFANFNNDGFNQNLIADNLSIVAVPEVSPAWMFGAPAIVGALLFGRRRRKA